MKPLREHARPWRWSPLWEVGKQGEGHDKGSVMEDVVEKKRRQRRRGSGRSKRQTLGPAMDQRGRVDDIERVLARELSPPSHWMAMGVRGTHARSTSADERPH